LQTGPIYKCVYKKIEED